MFTRQFRFLKIGRWMIYNWKQVVSRRRVAFTCKWTIDAPHPSQIRDSDSQKYEGGRVVAVSSFDRYVSPRTEWIKRN